MCATFKCREEILDVEDGEERESSEMRISSAIHIPHRENEWNEDADGLRGRRWDYPSEDMSLLPYLFCLNVCLHHGQDRG